MFQDIHPTETAQDGKPYRDERHLAPGEPSETLIWKCPHCGIYNDTRTENNVNTQGEGIKYVTVSIAIPGGSKSVVEPRRVTGCILCGHDYKTSTYRKKLFSDVNMAGR